MRINIIPVDILSDIHLRAEYREILMSPYYYIKSKSSKQGIDESKISPVYTLNKGHAYMWYDKFGYIRDRHNELEVEMLKRGFKTRTSNSIEPYLIQIPDSTFGTKTWVKEEIKVNLDRIIERIKEKYDNNKPNFYKLNGKNMTYEEWETMYTNYYKGIRC